MNKRTSNDLFGTYLYEKTRMHVYNMTKNFRNILSKEEIEDLAHDTYIKICSKKSKFKENGKFDAWVWQICRNAVFDCTKARTKHNSKILSLEDDVCNTSFLPNREILREEFKSRFWGAVNNLSPESRNVVELLMEETPYDEMAKTLGCSENTLRVKVCRARKELKKFNLAS